MSTFISDELIEKVKDNCEIVNIISDYIPLKKAGSNYVGLCPFHNEKTPSFTVSETKQFFHCFGCGEGGDSVTFIMKKENLDFPDAIKLLADKMGIVVEEEDKDNKKLFDARSKTYEINKEAARFFYNNIANNLGAKEYLKRRNISFKVTTQFGLGYSLDDWDSLYNYLTNMGYSSEEIEKTGLIGKKSGNNGYYDRFRNRIIFPIIDAKSRVVGFGGRVLDNSMPKYLNSQDTIVFNKGNHLYGLNLLNKFSDRKRILLVEGYMDVIALFSKGINYSIASLGTALTERQSKLIKRYGEEVFICYDSDNAGIKAALKAIEILLKVDVNPRIILLPPGMDPDDFINKKGLIEFEKLFIKSFSHMDFKIHINRKKYDINKPEDKIKFTIEISKIIKDLKSPIEQDVYIEKVSLETGISKEAIEKEIRGKSYNNKFIPKPYNSLRNVKELKNDIKPIKTILPSGQLKTEMDLIRLMMLERDYFDVITQKLSLDDFISIECKHIYELLMISYENEETIEEEVLFVKILEIPNLSNGRIKSIFENRVNFQPSNIDQIIQELIDTIINNNLLDKRKALILKIEELEKKHRSEEEDMLLNKLFSELNNLIKK